jgi:hypothetical protein
VKGRVRTDAFEPCDGPPDKRRLIDTCRGEKTDRVPDFEMLIESDRVAAILGRPAGDTLGIGGDAAKGAGEAVRRPMYPADYIELCKTIGQDCMCVECMWTPIPPANRTGEEDIEKTLGSVREYVRADMASLLRSDHGSRSRIGDPYQMVPSGIDCREHKKRCDRRVCLS